MKLINESVLEMTINFLKDVRDDNGVCLVGLIEDLEHIMQTPSVCTDDQPKNIRKRRLSDQED
ncbi:MAG TPA: hypothetical protein VIF10_08750 [Methylobacter sp.]|jgi:hypothetical protein